MALPVEVIAGGGITLSVGIVLWGVRAMLSNMGTNLRRDIDRVERKVEKASDLHTKCLSETIPDILSRIAVIENRGAPHVT